MSGRSNRHSDRGRGFTLLELLIALAVAGVLLGIAAPSFESTVADVRLTAEQNRLVKALRQARSEAIKRALPVTVCASENGLACNGDWGDGWLMYADTATTGTIGALDTNDAILAAHQAVAGRFTSSASATVRPDAASAVNSIRFGPRGRADWTLGSFVICDHRAEQAAHAIIVNGAGGLRSQRPHDGAVLDAAGAAVSC